MIPRIVGEVKKVRDLLHVMLFNYSTIACVFRATEKWQQESIGLLVIQETIGTITNGNYVVKML